MKFKDIKNTVNEGYQEHKDDKGYRVKQNPKDKKWYVIGHLGGNDWMPISDGYATEELANKSKIKQYQADKAAADELKTWDMK